MLCGIASSRIVDVEAAEEYPAELESEVLAEHAVEQRTGGGVYVTHGCREYHPHPGLMKWCIREGIVEEQDLVWGVTHKVNDNRRDQHLHDTFALLDRFRRFVLVVTIAWLVAMELRGAGE